MVYYRRFLILLIIVCFGCNTNLNYYEEVNKIMLEFDTLNDNFGDELTADNGWIKKDSEININRIIDLSNKLSESGKEAKNKLSSLNTPENCIRYRNVHINWIDTVTIASIDATNILVMGTFVSENYVNNLTNNLINLENEIIFSEKECLK